MIKGLYAAASAMVAGVTQQKILSHNIANINTPGFKQAMTSLDDFTDTAVEFSPGNITHSLREQYVGRLGLGVETTPEMTDFTPGGINMTGQPLDVALDGPGFFRVRTPDGERYTRDGRFLRDASNQLTTVDGFLVLDQNGQPIHIPDGEISIGLDGTIKVNNQNVARLSLAAFKDPEVELQRDPNHGNMFIAARNPTSQVVGQVHQGYLENSNANPAALMGQLVAVARAYEAAQQMVQNQDELLGKTIASLGQM